MTWRNFVYIFICDLLRELNTCEAIAPIKVSKNLDFPRPCGPLRHVIGYKKGTDGGGCVLRHGSKCSLVHRAQRRLSKASPRWAVLIARFALPENGRGLRQAKVELRVLRNKKAKILLRGVKQGGAISGASRDEVSMKIQIPRRLNQATWRSCVHQVHHFNSHLVAPPCRMPLASFN